MTKKCPPEIVAGTDGNDYSLSMAVTKRNAMSKKCRFCGYEWLSRKPDPKACPSCKRYHWEKKP